MTDDIREDSPGAGQGSASVVCALWTRVSHMIVVPTSQLIATMKATSTVFLAVLSSITNIFPVRCEDSVQLVYPNHRYSVTSSPPSLTPRSLQPPVLNHLAQKVSHQRIPHVRPKNSTFLSSRLSMTKRSGDYHYGPVDYPQYDEDHGHYGHHYPAIRTVHYPRYPMMEKPSPKIDISSFGLLAIFKLVLVKILSFGVFKLILLLLLKFPIILFTLGFKFLIILKLIKLVKLLTIPILIPFILILVFPIILIGFFLLLPLLLPLILAPVIPLILIPILLPLLLSIPVPVLAPTGRRRRAVEDAQARSVQDDVLYLVKRVLESEQCIERVACQFAANKQSQGYTSFVAWYLDKVARFMKTPRFSSYTEAYKKGTSSGVTPNHCMRLYACNNPRKAL